MSSASFDSRGVTASSTERLHEPGSLTVQQDLQELKFSGIVIDSLFFRQMLTSAVRLEGGRVSEEVLEASKHHAPHQGISLQRAVERLERCGIRRETIEAVLKEAEPKLEALAAADREQRALRLPWHAGADWIRQEAKIRRTVDELIPRLEQLKNEAIAKGQRRLDVDLTIDRGGVGAPDEPGVLAVEPWYAVLSRNPLQRFLHWCPFTRWVLPRYDEFVVSPALFDLQKHAAQLGVNAALQNIPNNEHRYDFALRIPWHGRIQGSPVRIRESLL